MVDQELVFAKIGAARSHILRIEKKRGDDSAAFLADQDRQDIVAFNFQAAMFCSKRVFNPEPGMPRSGRSRSPDPSVCGLVSTTSSMTSN
jgi:hypothetical protein